MPWAENASNAWFHMNKLIPVARVDGITGKFSMRDLPPQNSKIHLRLPSVSINLWTVRFSLISASTGEQGSNNIYKIARSLTDLL